MLSVAIAFEYGTLSGGERSMLAVIDHLRHRGVNFTALAPQDGALTDALRRRGLRHVPLELRDGDGRRLPRTDAEARLIAAAEAAGAELVHANSLAMGRLTGAVAGRLPVPCTAHLRDILRLSAAAVADLNRNRRLVAVSRATATFHAAQAVHAERLRVVHNGIDADAFRSLDDGAPSRAELGLPADGLLALTVGQIGLRKGLDVLAEAAVLLRERLPHLHHVIAGERFSQKRESVEFEAAIVLRFAQSGLADHLHILGYRADVPRLMAACDLLVHPARQEPFGRVLLEGAACGLPILATDVGGTPEMLTHAEHAWLIPPNDPPALAGAIARLATDRPLRERLAAAAGRRIRNEFTTARAAEGLLAEWEEVISAPLGERWASARR
jgi:glycosyltransferase involved in cell wall biosynthesis